VSAARGGVEGDEVDVGPQLAGDGREQSGLPGVVVDARDERPLDGRATTRGCAPRVDGRDDRVEWMAPVDGDEFVPE
jgi:hypothetical protein